ncbi:MAG: hypothetical protein ACRDWA_16280 [Acidimicrobiia bacterium]
MRFLLLVVALVGCSSPQLGDVLAHSQLQVGELVEVLPNGDVEVVTEVPSDAGRAVVLADGIEFERDSSIFRSEGDEFVEAASGTLLAADRRGERFATFTEGSWRSTTGREESISRLTATSHWQGYGTGPTRS